MTGCSRVGVGKPEVERKDPRLRPKTDEAKEENHNFQGFRQGICPLEIETERKKWEAFIKQEMELNLLTGQ